MALIAKYKILQFTMTAKARGPVINSAKIQVLSLGVTKPHKYDNIWAQAGERDLKLQRKKTRRTFLNFNKRILS